MALVSATAFAEVAADVSVGAATNKVYRGDTLSQRGASANVDAKLTHVDTGLFAKYDGSTVEVAPRSANLRHVVDLGVEHKYANGVGVNAGYRQFLWTGGASAAGAASDLNSGEVFLGASAYGFTGEIAKTTSSSVVNPSKDSFVKVGYAHSFDAVTVKADVLRTGFSRAGTTGYGYDVGAAYAFTPKLSVGVDYTHAGKNATGAARPNQIAATLSYTL